MRLLAYQLYPDTSPNPRGLPTPEDYAGDMAPGIGSCQDENGDSHKRIRVSPKLRLFG